MKKYWLVSTLTILLLCVNSCTKFEPAIIDLKVTPIQAGTSTLLLDCEGTITDNGGCKFINEMGFLFSFNPELTYKADEVTTIVAAEDLETTVFDLTYTVPVECLDTACYVRAYVCTNAGTGYSEPQLISTHLLTDPTAK